MLFKNRINENQHVVQFFKKNRFEVEEENYLYLCELKNNATIQK